MSFQLLVEWSLREFPHLPWRTRRSLYHTLVSEIMLQQTTVPTVLNHFDRFLTKYPDLKSLAAATEEEICVAWKGLGYYRRARSLLAAAQDIVNNHAGEIPLDFQQLLKIPGIGAYTANALLAIGADVVALPLDANLERVLSRYYLVDELKGVKLQKKIDQLFKQEKILPELWQQKLSAREVSEALMDLGRTICKAQSADCPQCPLNTNCQAYQENKVSFYPRTEVEAQKSPTTQKNKNLELHLLRLIIKKNNQSFYLVQKEKGEWLEGQWEFPTFILQTDDPKINQYQVLTAELKKDLKQKLKDLPQFKSGITKYKISNYLLEMSADEFKKNFLSFLKDKNFSYKNILHDNENLANSVIKSRKYFLL